MAILTTKRLCLRPWKETDWIPFFEMNSDPRVMEFFPAMLSQEESLRMGKRLQAKIEERGWGFWAVSIPGKAEFIGFIGLNFIDHDTLPVPFTPATEIGWRLAFEHWGQGYATEGATACLAYGFETLKLSAIVAFTAASNTRSRNVMEKLGMQRDPQDDFDHPKVPATSPLRKHVLYRLSQKKYNRPSLS